MLSVFLYFAKFSTEVYESNMKVKANAISNQAAISYINKLSELTEAINKQELMKQLGIDSVTASKISNIGAFWYIDLDGDGIGNYIDIQNEYFKAPEDSISSRITKYFSIRIEYTEGINVSSLSQNIIEYVNKNPYFVKANEIRKKQILETYNITKIEQKKLDTTRVKYNQAVFENRVLPEIQKGQLVFLNGDPSKVQEVKLYYPEIFSLEEKAQKLTKSLELTPEIITIIENFTLSNKPVQSFFRYTKYSILLLFLGIFSITIFENRKRILELKKESSLK